MKKFFQGFTSVYVLIVMMFLLVGTLVFVMTTVVRQQKTFTFSAGVVETAFGATSSGGITGGCEPYSTNLTNYTIGFSSDNWGMGCQSEGTTFSLTPGGVDDPFYKTGAECEKSAASGYECSILGDRFSSYSSCVCVAI